MPKMPAMLNFDCHLNPPPTREKQDGGSKRASCVSVCALSDRHFSASRGPTLSGSAGVSASERASELAGQRGNNEASAYLFVISLFL